MERIRHNRDPIHQKSVTVWQTKHDSLKQLDGSTAQIEDAGYSQDMFHKLLFSISKSLFHIRTHSYQITLNIVFKLWSTQPSS